MHINLQCNDSGAYGCFLNIVKTKKLINELYKQSDLAKVIDASTNKKIDQLKFFEFISHNNIAIKVFLLNNNKQEEKNEIKQFKLLRKNLNIEKFTTYKTYKKSSCFYIKNLKFKIEDNILNYIFIILQEPCQTDILTHITTYKDFCKFDSDISEFFNIYHKFSVHKDIKIDNIVYCSKSNRYKVIDFGKSQELKKTNKHLMDDVPITPYFYSCSLAYNYNNNSDDFLIFFKNYLKKWKNDGDWPVNYKIMKYVFDKYYISTYKELQRKQVDVLTLMKKNDDCLYANLLFQIIYNINPNILTDTTDEARKIHMRMDNLYLRKDKFI